MSYYRIERPKTQAESDAEALEQWNFRVKKVINPIEERQKVRTNLDILEYHEDSKIRMEYYTPNEAEENRLVEQIKQTDPNFDKEYFKRYADYVIRDFFRAFSNKNMDALRKSVDVNIIALFNSRIYQNTVFGIEEHFELLDTNYVDFFGYQKEANVEIISVAIGMVYYTYKKKKSGEIVDGSDKIKRRSTFLLSFARNIGGQTIKTDDSFKSEGITCYNCGAKITNPYSRCEYCGTVMYNSTENWLLNHIEKL